MIDRDTVRHIAERNSLPPSLVQSLSTQGAPEGLLASYGLDKALVESDPAAALTVIAHSVGESFAKTGNLQGALSRTFAGNDTAYQSPTSPVGGLVNGILGVAARDAALHLDGFRPTDVPRFAAVAKDFGNYLQETRDAGGNVTDESLKHWHDAVATIAPPPKPTTPMGSAAGAVHHDAPLPSGPAPRDVEAFAGQMKGLGIDIEHFTQNFAHYASLRQKMLNAKTSLQDYAPVNGMQPSEMLQHVREQPHPTYNHITAGAFSDMKDAALLHSRPVHNRDPHDKEVASLVSAGAKWNDVRDFYAHPGGGSTQGGAPHA